MTTEQVSVIEPNLVEHRWERPREGFVKINFDAAFKPETGDGLVGFIARTDSARESWSQLVLES